MNGTYGHMTRYRFSEEPNGLNDKAWWRYEKLCSTNTAVTVVIELILWTECKLCNPS